MKEKGLKHPDVKEMKRVRNMCGLTGMDIIRFFKMSYTIGGKVRVIQWIDRFEVAWIFGGYESEADYIY